MVQGVNNRIEKKSLFLTAGLRELPKTRHSDVFPKRPTVAVGIYVLLNALVAPGRTKNKICFWPPRSICNASVGTGVRILFPRATNLP